MNYRHAFHAGNPGDVLKHAALAACLAHLGKKPKPFRALDTHAGLGVYDLAGREALTTREFETGVGRLWEDRPAGAAGAALTPWYAVLDALNPEGALVRYPGSPEIVARMLRPGDRAALCELRPDDAASLARRYRGDRRITVERKDGWSALAALLPPPERRGLVLIDPPYETQGEMRRLADALAEALARFATGIVLAWYPVKGSEEPRRLARAAAEIGAPKLLRAELHTRQPNHPGRLDGAGLLIANPPHTLPAELRMLLPELARRLATGPGAGHFVESLGAERL
jgi:23S rRNA (adenine2030-N6)-methyltransferase